MSKYLFNPKAYRQLYERPWEYRTPAFKIIDNLYFVGNKDGASWLLDTNDGLILFDTNYPTANALLIDSIWQLGFNPRNIVAIFHTHGHFDHIGSTNFLKELSLAKTYLGEGDVKMFKERPELALLSDSRNAYTELFDADIAVKDNDEFTFGKTVIKAISCPGHTPGATSYFFDVYDKGKIYRVGLHGGAGINTLCKAFRERHGVDWRKEYLDSMDKIMDEKVDIFLGNHTLQNNALEKYERMKENSNPFIDPNEWKRFMQAMKEKVVIMDKEEENE